MIRFLQANLNKCAEAHDMLPVAAREEGVDILVISEPNEARLRASGTRWLTDEESQQEKNVGIWCDPLKSVATRHGGGEGHVWAEVNGLIVFSCYFSPNKSLEEFENFLFEVERSMAEAGGDRGILTGDLNAAAVERGSRRTDRRGEAVLELMARRGLEVANPPAECRLSAESAGRASCRSLLSTSRSPRGPPWRGWALAGECGKTWRAGAITASSSLRWARRTTPRCPWKRARWHPRKFDFEVLKAEIDVGCERMPERPTGRTSPTS